MIETVNIFYQCTSCDRKIERQLQYLDPKLFKNNEAKQHHAFWCGRCDAQYTTDFIIEKKDNNEYKVITLKLTCDDKTINKRLKIKKAEKSNG